VSAAIRLSEVLRDRREAILHEFEDYARTHTASGASMDVEALRDHAAGMLEAMALDLEQPQTDAEQERKGKGDARGAVDAPRTAAEQHGVGRARSGFSMEETFAEYRALRASVMRHYVGARGEADSSNIQDIIRFNEAVDQALAEAVTEYAQTVTNYRETFLAVLGHDLRSPLNAILSASEFLAETTEPSGRDHRLAASITHSGMAMKGLIDDMLAYKSAQLGHGLTLRRTPADMGEIAADVVQEVELAHPGREIRLRVQGDGSGEWDQDRVRQALSNLVTNAARHAAADSAITVTVSGADGGGDVVVTVHNLGSAIPEDERELIFQPFRQAAARNRSPGGYGGGIGLGLYIARRMAEAHGGTVAVESSAEAGTTFAMSLPRSPSGGRARADQAGGRA
jgi:signal transduction histidine kinase